MNNLSNFDLCLLLQCFQEECSEAIKEASKCVRFGAKNKWKKYKTPGERLAKEICDVEAYITMVKDVMRSNPKIFGKKTRKIINEERADRIDAKYLKFESMKTYTINSKSPLSSKKLKHKRSKIAGEDE